jgi:outer membrane protein assembly factor BamB
MKTNLTGRHISAAAVFITASLVTAACSGTPVTVTNSAGAEPLASGSWSYPNGDLADTRDAAGSTITSANVSGLKQAWTFHITGPAAAGIGSAGALSANPIVVNGVVYIQDLDANVYALSLATGKLKWEHKLNTPMKTGPGPDGVAVAGGTVYGISPTTVFALNARTGHQIWADSHLLGTGQGTFEIQPQVADGRVYLASAYGSGRAAPGRRRWSAATDR